jgi:hypothetical protein
MTSVMRPEQPMFDSGTSSLELLELQRMGSQRDDADHAQPAATIASSS